MAGFGLVQLAVAAWSNDYDLMSLWGTLYFSGTTFFTLGLGDLAATSALGRAITILEAGTGFGFLALVIAYLPVLYQAFSRREVSIALLDARAGSPPSVAGLLTRYARAEQLAALEPLFQDWETWCAELLESILSYPVLAYYRSQHERQSWLSFVTTILDTCALVLVGIEGVSPWQARLTFAMARHAVVDLCQVLDAPPIAAVAERMPAATLHRMLAEAGVQLRSGPEADAYLAELRQGYEPYVQALAAYLLLPLPGWLPEPGAVDDWQSSAWDPPLQLR